MGFLFKLSTRVQLILLVILSVLPALFIIIYTGIEQRNQKMIELEHTAFSLMKTISNRQQVIMESSHQLFNTLSRMPEVINLNQQACNILFRNLLPDNPLYANIFLVNRRGMVVSAAVPVKAFDVSHRKYFRDAITTRNFSTGEYLVALMTQSPVFTLSHPITDKRGEIKGVLGLALNLKRYDFLISDAGLPEGSVLALTDYKGVRLYRYPDADKYRGTQDRPEMLRHMSGSLDEGTFIEKGADGIQRHYSFRRFRLSPDAPPYLYMRMGIPQTKAFADIWFITGRNLIILWFIFLFALACAWIVGDYLIANPLGQLTAIAKRFRAGERDFKEKLPEASNSEIKQLSDAFEEMIMELKAREDEQKKHLEEIEQAKKTLQANETQLSNAMEIAHLGHWEYDVVTDLFTFNDHFYKLFRTSVEQVGSYKIRSAEYARCFLHPDDIHLVGEEINKSIETMTPDSTQQLEHRIRYADGTDGYISVRIFIVKDPHGRTIKTYGVNQDITERKKTEEAIRESERRFRSLAELLPETVFETDHQGNLTFVNLNAFMRFGYTQEDLSGGLNVLNMIIPGHREIAVRNFQRIMSGKDIGANEYTMERKDGSTFPAAIHSTAIMRNSHPVGIRGFLIDITYRRQAEAEKHALEERLQRAEKMEALGTLAGGVAHDLNNVLGIVVGYAEMLLDEADENSVLRPSLLSIMDGGQRAAAIVQDLLTLARRGVSHRQVVNLNTIITGYKNSPEFLKLCSYHPDVKINMDLNPDLLNISGSPIHLGKSFFNLISNASEAMPHGGAITISTANHYMDKPIQGYDEIREGDYVELSVSDTGQGIPETDLKRIFEPFYTKKVMGRSGTGLGLAVVWGTVKDHNGYINVQSGEGKGSIFTLYFPVTREEASPETMTVKPSQYLGHGESILVVDDVQGQRELATSILRKLHYSVSNVSSGEEAVEFLKENHVDLLVLDMIMDPGMDGLDTYRKVLEMKPGQKAIIVSGFSESERVKTAESLGVGAYVSKPYVTEKLGLAVRRVFEKQNKVNP